MIRTKEKMLRQAGYAQGPDGCVYVGGAASRLFHAWVQYLTDALDARCDDRIDGPPFISPAILERTGYVDNFPQHVMRGATHDDGGASTYLTPAACFHVYPMFAKRALHDDVHATRIQAACSRYEGGCWEHPFRLSSFHMLEFVHVGSCAAIVSRRDDMLERVQSLMRGAGLAGEFRVSTDAFFLGESAGAGVMQKLKGLKREYEVSVDGKGVALASVNLHEDYFGKRFDIRDRAGDTAWSFCAAFGIERLTAAGLMLWGGSPESWPEVLRP